MQSSSLLAGQQPLAAGRPFVPRTAQPQRCSSSSRVRAIAQPEHGAAAPPPLSDEVAALVAEAGIDLDRSGLTYLSNEARARALAKKANKFEKIKNEKGGHRIWTEVSELAALVREGTTKWEDLDLDDVDVRLKWAGLFHRRKRTPGRYMMRLKVPNGELTAEQLRFMGDVIAKHGADGCADITTRANMQLRGITTEELDVVFKGMQEVGLTSVQAGMDNVRNMTGSPIAGIDPHEHIDSRAICKAIDNMITANGLGNPELCNLPRKINIAVSTSRDDFPHCHINDVGLKSVVDPETGEVGFNVEVGGYFSIKRNTMSMPMDTYLTQEQVVPFCKALLEVFRDHGEREDRQKARIMWLVEKVGVDAFRDMIAAQMGVPELAREKHVGYDDVWKRRDVLGVHAQKQAGYSWVGACVPAGRLVASDFHEFARLAETYGDGTMRLTVEENVLFPFIPNDKLGAFLAEPIFQKYLVDAGPLTRGLVSCTGAQFCGIAMIETKNRAMQVAAKLEQQLDIPATVRIHWTGCPNSCGQAQVADIGLMGSPAKLDGKAVEGVKVFLGGSIGENPALAQEFEKGIPCDESVLLPKLRDLLVEHFGATPKPAAA
jgi:ferredoxin-nitrite reductase